MIDWIDSFIEYTAHLGTPPIFRKWTAISIIAAAVERKVWVRTNGAELYPNLYIALVAPPGIGKTKMTSRAREFIAALPKHHVSHSSVTKSALIDTLGAATRHITNPNAVPAVTTYNALYVSANEMGVLLPAYDNEFMAVLTDLWDGLPFSEKRRTKDHLVEIKKPQLNMLAACTPNYLLTTLPEGAWDQGFTTRTIFVYSGDNVHVGLFDEPSESIEHRKFLDSELLKISELMGKLEWSDEAKQIIINWHNAGCPPAPDHPRLLAYLPRRIVHTQKVAMCVAISATRKLVIEKEHILRAIDLMIEAENDMPEIFKASGGSSHARIIDDIWHFLFRTYNKEGKRPINSTRLTNFVSQRVPAHNVQQIIDVMTNAGMIARVVDKDGLCYIPRAREQ